MAIALLLLAAAAAVAGLVLAAIGLRGRRVDAHPHCRRCGYDLAGTPDATVCTECGRDLTAERAVRHGTRARRGRLVTAGAMLLLPTLALLAAVGYGVVAGVDWQRHKPQAWLRWDARSADSVAADAAAAELRRRWESADDALSPASVAALAEAILDRQADPTRPWEIQKDGGFIEALAAQGELSEGQWRRFLEQALAIEIEVRPAARPGDPLPIRLRPVFDRGGPSGGIVGVYEVVAVSFAGRPVDPPPGSGSFSVYPGGNTSWSFYFKSLPGRVPTDLPAGPAELSVTVRSTYVVGQHNDVRIRRHHEGTPREYDEFILLPEPHAERKVAARATTRVLAADAPVPTAIAGPEFRDAVHAGVLASQVAQAAWFPGTGLYVRVEADGSPVRVRGVAYLRWRGRDVALDDWPVDLNPSRPYAFRDLRLGDDARDLALRAAKAGEPVALVIRPEVDDALDLIDPEPIWGETLIFPGLPVRDAPEGLRPDRPAEAMRDNERTP